MMNVRQQRSQRRVGLVDGRLRPCANTPNCVSSQPADARRRMEPLRFHVSPTEAMQRLQNLLAQLPRVNIVSSGDRYLHAAFTTRWLRFVDDVEFLLVEEEQAIHFRSSSRLGHWDFGANRRRMADIQRRWLELADRAAPQ